MGKFNNSLVHEKRGGGGALPIIKGLAHVHRDRHEKESVHV